MRVSYSCFFSFSSELAGYAVRGPQLSASRQPCHAMPTAPALPLRPLPPRGRIALWRACSACLRVRRACGQLLHQPGGGRSSRRWQCCSRGCERREGRGRGSSGRTRRSERKNRKQSWRISMQGLRVLY